MATVVDTMTWAAVSTALKAHLGISGTAEDTTLAMLLDAACREADAFLGATAFEDEDGLDITIPGSVYLGVYEWVKLARADFGLRPELSAVTTAQLSETYARPRSAKSYTEAVKHFWQPCRVKVWR